MRCISAREAFDETAPLPHEALRILAGVDDIGLSRVEYEKVYEVWATERGYRDHEESIDA